MKAHIIFIALSITSFSLNVFAQAGGEGPGNSKIRSGTKLIDLPLGMKFVVQQDIHFPMSSTLARVQDSVVNSKDLNSSNAY